MKALFLVPYPPGSAPSQRFRFEQYLHALKAAGIDVEMKPFISSGTWKILYRKGSGMAKFLGIIRGFIKRIALLPLIRNSDVIFIHREATPVGPPIMEWLIAKIYRKKMIYDFDDAIWLPNTSGENSIAYLVKFHSKVASICRWSRQVSAGNDFLASYARRFNKAVTINPTTIDTERLHNTLKDQHTSEMVIGWTGSHSTLKYLDMIIPVLHRLEKSHRFTFLVIADRDPQLQLKSYRFIRWRQESEIEDLLQLNIGVMPLKDDEWSKGKCGFKILQYMALGIPAVASPVGVNSRIVEHGMNGFLAGTAEEWYEKLKLLTGDPALRSRMGNNGRQKVEREYSVKSNTANFLELFQPESLGRPGRKPNLP